ncbi:MAG: hypothetical protein GEV11_24485 [Streptosporangiales bacterium]|nr:hypothetical protein [Streptosporangiales bacterium]
MEAPRGRLVRGRISHLFLKVRDLDAMVAFYHDILGFRIDYHVAGEAAFLSLGGGIRLAFYPGRTAEAAERDWFLVIDVDDVERSAADLAAAHVEVTPVENVPYGRAATLRDPDGNVIEIHQPRGHEI